MSHVVHFRAERLPYFRRSQYPHTDLVDYRLASVGLRERGPFKAAMEQGRVHVVPQFRQGFNGRGAERYRNGSVYVGQYQDAKRHGKGTMTTEDGSLMVSFWKNKFV